MKLHCKRLVDHEDRSIFLESDENGREIYHYRFTDSLCVGENLLYPNVRIYSKSDESLCNPLEERVMSLQSLNSQVELEFSSEVERTFDEPVFFFIYNTDNYFHFIYDSVPHIYSYLHLKRSNPELKLLMSFPNSDKSDHYKFVKDTLRLLGIENDDIVVLQAKTLYRKIYVSSSYTHGLDSNLPPRSEVYEILRSIPTSPVADLPRKFYVSRRSWVHGDYSNIGTDYTSRRKLLNEDDLVDSLKKLGFKEVFTENFSMNDKIELFKNAEHIVGAIGGGMANCLFSNFEAKTSVIVSPTFLDVNLRFSHCFKTRDVAYLKNTRHFDDRNLKRYMRVMTHDGKVGEIIDVDDDHVTIAFADSSVAGWNNSMKYQNLTYKRDNVVGLDNGLNSEWVCDIDEVVRRIE